MPKLIKVPSTITYLPAPKLPSLQPPPPPSSPSHVLAPPQPEQPPVIYPPSPPGSTPQPAQPGAEFTADPIRLKTWGPYTYIHDPHKKEKLRVNKEGYAIRKKTRAPVDLAAALSGKADKSLDGKLQITLECKEESYGTQLVETMADGAIKKTWVTSLVVTTWETERPAKERDMVYGEDGEGSERSERSERSSSEESEDSVSDRKGIKGGKKVGRKR